MEIVTPGAVNLELFALAAIVLLLIPARPCSISSGALSSRAGAQDSSRSSASTPLPSFTFWQLS